jgi:hypothetical protein
MAWRSLRCRYFFVVAGAGADVAGFIGAGDRLEWVKLSTGAFTVKTRGFTITLSPETQGRWRAALMHDESGYNPPFPVWQPTLDRAKFNALICLEDAIPQVVTNKEWKAQRSA